MRILSHVFLAFLGISSGLLMSEFILRLAVPQRMFALPPLYRDDSRTVFSLLENYVGTFAMREFSCTVVTNSIGLRDHEVPPKTDRTFRILGLGDSFSFANGVELHETYFKRLEATLKINGKRVEVINCAVPGFGPSQEFETLKKYRDLLQPDAVLIGFFVGNDFVESMDLYDDDGNPLMHIEDGYIVTNKPADKEKSIIRDVTKQARAYLNTSSHLYVFMRDRLSSLLGRWGLLPFDLVPEFCEKEYSARMQRGVETTRAVLHELAAYTRAQRLPLLAVVLPTIYQVDTEAWDLYVTGLKLDATRYDLDKPQRVLGEILANESIQFIDVLPALRANARKGQRQFFPVDGHLNAAGHIVIADAIASYVGAHPLVSASVVSNPYPSK